MVFGPIGARAPAIYLCASNEFPIVFSARKGVTYIYIAGVRGDERLSMCMCECVCAVESVKNLLSPRLPQS